VQVDFRNVQMRYRDGLPLVLRGLSVTVAPGSRCGVVGRTGAGKSSLINCLFRLQELNSGSIVIDGVDIAKMGLKDLRTNMAIIPQVSSCLAMTGKTLYLCPEIAVDAKGTVMDRSVIMIQKAVFGWAASCMTSCRDD